MIYRIEYALWALGDLEKIAEHLRQSYIHFGDAPDEARERALARAISIRRAAERLSHHPFRGTLRDPLMAGLRSVTIERATYWFTVRQSERTVTVIAIFYGQQDHIRAMMTRLEER